MTDGGYVKIYRSVIGHPAFRNDAEAMVLAWMVLRAAWRPTRVRYKGRVINLQRGQLVVSIRDMAAAHDRDKTWIERLLKRLKSEAVVETITEAGVSVISICKYDEFQGEIDVSQAPRETPRKTRVRQRRDTEQEKEEGKKEEVELESNDSNSTKRGRSRPAVQPVPDKPDDVSEQVWSDFLTHRKRHDSDLTTTALAGFMREATDVGWTLEQAITESILRGWRGFKAEWVSNDGRNSAASGRFHQHGQGDGFSRALDKFDAGIASRRGYSNQRDSTSDAVEQILSEASQPVTIIDHPSISG